MFASLTRPVIAAVCLAATALTGCQNYIFRTFDVDRADSLSIDAKQRLVFVTERGGRTGNRRVVCAEPSPDALSAMATAGSAAISFPQLLPAGGNAAPQTGQASAAGGFSSTEAAASIGLRTQAIQLLRDSLYRACEAYMNGVIDRTEYTFILMNIDRVMISLVGIDAIGGTPTASEAAVHAAAAAPKVTLSKDGTTTVESTALASPAGQSKSNETKSVKVDAGGAAAIEHIVAGNVRHTTFPAVCTSLLASGELDPRIPSQRVVLEACSNLVTGIPRRVLAGS